MSYSVVRILSVCLISLLSLSAYAHTSVVVVPMGGNDNPQNLIVVAKQGGDFDNPIDALNSIKDAASDNRYRIFIMPGTYTLTGNLVMKPYVDIVGSGRKSESLTALEGTQCSDNEDANLIALVIGADNSSIRSLTIENICTGGENYCTGFASIGTSPTLIDVSARCSGNAADVSGIYLSNSSAKMMYFEATASSTHSDPYVSGIWVSDSTSGTPEISHFTASTSGSDNSSERTGIYCDDPFPIVISHGVLDGDDYSASYCNSDFRFSSLTEDYFATSTNGYPTCFATDDGAGNLLDAACDPLP